MEGIDLLNDLKSFKKKEIDFSYKYNLNDKNNEDIGELLKNIELKLYNKQEMDEARDEIRVLRNERLDTKALNEKMALSMIDMISQLEVIYNFAVSADEENMKKIPVLIKRVEKLYNKLLNRCGIHEIESLGEIFNPEEHEYIESRDANENEENDEVVEVIQKGYRYANKVLIPTKVKIAKK